jgi:hypothetical protein
MKKIILIFIALTFIFPSVTSAKEIDKIEDSILPVVNNKTPDVVNEAIKYLPLILIRVADVVKVLLNKRIIT